MKTRTSGDAISAHFVHSKYGKISEISKTFEPNELHETTHSNDSDSRIKIFFENFYHSLIVCVHFATSLCVDFEKTLNFGQTFSE